MFDRVRENIGKRLKGESFGAVVGRSLRETVGRSINTSVTVMLALLPLLFLGSASTQHFALTLMIGVIAGAYSSIFLASPLLVVLHKDK